MADAQPTKRGGKICAAIGCHNTTYNSEVSLFRFPNEKDKDRSKKWVINSRRADLDGKTATQLYNNCRMCSNHFEDSQFKDPAHKSLMHYAVPTIFESVPNPPPRIASKRQRKERHTPELHTSAKSYLGTVCMFGKMLSVVLFLRQSPLLGVIYIILCIIHLAFLPEPVYSGPTSVMYFSGGSNLQDELERDKRVTWLVEFYAAWLPSCVNFSPIYAPLSAKYSLENLKFAKIDVTRYPEVAKQYNVSTSTWSKQLPTLVLFENGKETIRRPIMNSKNRVACKFIFSEMNVVQAFDLNDVYDKCKKNIQNRRKDKKPETKTASLKKEE